MKIIGITGQSGAGKGKVGGILAKQGYYVIDADEVYHSLLYKNSRLCICLSEHFGKTILCDGTINRKKLADIVFSDKEKLAELNKITHAYVKERINEIASERNALGDLAVFIDAPQLFEASMQKNCDFVIGVIADKCVRAKRIACRDGLTESEIEKRFSNQKNEGFFKKYCDFVIENNGNEEHLYTQIENICREMGLLWEKR